MLKLINEFVVKPKFMRPMHSEAKETKTSEFGVEKGIEKAKQGEWDGSCSKDPKSLMVLGEVFIGKIWGEVCRVFDVPLIGWW